MPNLNLKNFAKIKDSDFSIKDITVFAGKPGSGKSYIMKFQYAYTEAISSIVNETYKMHYALMDSEDNDQNILQAFRYSLSDFGIHNQDKINQYIDINDYTKAFELIASKANNPKEANKSFFDMFKNILNKLSEKQKKSLLDSEDEKFNFIFRNILESTFGDINQINDNFIYSTKETIIN